MNKSQTQIRRTNVWKLFFLLATLLAVVLLVLFGVRSTYFAKALYKCGPYPEWQTSDYILPYPKGKSYRVSQGNCYGGHLSIDDGSLRHSYDFDMPIGSTITASRSGRVVYTRTHFKDGNGGGPIGTDNVLLIQHNDGTFALYGHLTFNGVLVNIGEEIEKGEQIALSGNTGRTGGLPHLHFMVSKCPDGRIPCGYELTSIPVTFRNTRANPEGLMTDEIYAAF